MRGARRRFRRQVERNLRIAWVDARRCEKVECGALRHMSHKSRVGPYVSRRLFNYNSLRRLGPHEHALAHERSCLECQVGLAKLISYRDEDAWNKAVHKLWNRVFAQLHTHGAQEKVTQT